MTLSKWDLLYQTAYQQGLEKLSSLEGVCCAFHSVVDGLIRVTPGLITPLLQHPSLKQAALEGCRGELPMEIHSPEDFMRGLFYSLSRGSALQRMIRSSNTYQWVMKHFGPGEIRLGGTAGNMARSLAPLGIPVTVYANPLTVELANLFGEYPNLGVIAKQDGTFVKIPPQKAARESGIFAIHWIFEYTTDFEMDLDGVRVNPHRANRYIPSWNPVNNQFRMNLEFAQGFLARLDSYSHLLFSGFHILSESYPDGTSCIDVIQPLSNYLARVRKRSPRLKIHLELASIASPVIRRSILEYILPFVHSIGLNETELPLFLEPLEIPARQTLGENPSAVHFLRALALFLRKAQLERVHFHNLGYYISLERKPWTSRETSRNALLFAAIMAAARARNGLFSCREDIEAGLSAPVAERGLRELSEVAKFLDNPAFLETGTGTLEEFTLSMIPTRLVQNPLFTVGLGDTISSGAFLTA